jgi:hypothetical protein
MVKASPNKYFVGIILICIVSFPTAFALSKAKFGQDISYLWPRFEQLKSYCSQNYCLYDSNFVAITYVIQAVYSILAFFIAIIVNTVFKKVEIRIIKSFLIISIIFLSAMIYLFLEDFTFSSSEISLRRVAMNSVHVDPFGIFRIAWIAILSNIITLYFLFSKAK